MESYRRPKGTRVLPIDEKDQEIEKKVDFFNLIKCNREKDFLCSIISSREKCQIQQTKSLSKEMSANNHWKKSREVNYGRWKLSLKEGTNERNDLRPFADKPH